MTVPISYIFDAGFERCSLVSVFSLLKHSSTNQQILLFSNQTAASYFRDVERLAAAFPESSIETHPFPHLDEHGGTRGHITSATMLRLFLHRVVDGRTLYIDGDTLIRRDITPLLEEDLQGHPIGACRSPRIHASFLAASQSRWVLRRKPHRERIARLKAVPGLDPENYFNAGVLIFDMKRIREEGFVTPLEDWRAAEAYPNRDQDHLNFVFKKRIHLIPPEWNSIWGNVTTNRLIFTRRERDFYAASRLDPAIVHYTGAQKPWNSAPYSRRRGERRWREEWKSYAAQFDRLLSGADEARGISVGEGLKA